MHRHLSQRNSHHAVSMPHKTAITTITLTVWCQYHTNSYHNHNSHRVVSKPQRTVAFFDFTEPSFAGRWRITFRGQLIVTVTDFNRDTTITFTSIPCTANKLSNFSARSLSGVSDGPWEIGAAAGDAADGAEISVDGASLSHSKLEWSGSKQTRALQK